MQGRRAQRGCGVRKIAHDEVGVEIHQPGVVAHEAADEGAPGELGKRLVLDRLDLSRRELELLRNLVERQTRGFARRFQARAGTHAGLDRRVAGGRDIGFGHWQPSTVIAFVSGESGKRFFICETYESSACESPSLRSMHMPR